MIIKFNGSQTLSDFTTNVYYIVADIVDRAGLSESLTNEFKLKDVEVGVTLNVEGKEQFLEVTHDGLSEVFKVNVKLKNDGTIDFRKDNENVSFLDDYTRSLSRGDEKVYEEITSVYEDENLKFINKTDGGDIIECVYTDITTNDTVIRYYKNNILIGEFAYNSEEQKSQVR